MRTKIRLITEDPRELELFEKAIDPLVKRWGSRRLIQKRIIERDPEHNKYSSTFGMATHVGYYKITFAPNIKEALTIVSEFAKVMEAEK